MNCVRQFNSPRSEKNKSMTIITSTMTTTRRINMLLFFFYKTMDNAISETCNRNGYPLYGKSRPLSLALSLRLNAHLAHRRPRLGMGTRLAAALRLKVPMIRNSIALFPAFTRNASLGKTNQQQRNNKTKKAVPVGYISAHPPTTLSQVREKYQWRDATRDPDDRVVLRPHSGPYGSYHHAGTLARNR